MREKIKKFIEANLIRYDQDRKFTDDDNIFSKGYVSSLFAMKLLNYLEAEFNISINTDEMQLQNFSSVNNIVSFVEKKLNA